MLEKIGTLKATGGRIQFLQMSILETGFTAKARKSSENFEAKNQAQSLSGAMFRVMPAVHFPWATMVSAQSVISPYSMAP
jgi:hypothetical protein